MFNLFKSKVRTKKSPNPSHAHNLNSLENIQCVYAIGDVHGCYDELRDLLAKIEESLSQHTSENCAIIFLGDLVDRGPDSFRVLEFLKDYKPDGAQLIFLKGNHEEVFLKVLEGSIGALQSWFGFGGRACLRSYGVDNLGQIQIDPESLIGRIQNKVPKSHTQFISKFEDYVIVENYMFVHAGIRPRTAIHKQSPRDMRWIRDEFINFQKPHPFIIVHGHTIVKEAELHPNRIAVDTGAYNNGPLTAVKIVLNTEEVTSISSKIFEKEPWSEK